MAVSKKQQACVARYSAKNYDQLLVRVKKGRRDEIQAHAESMGESVNAFIGRAIAEAMERDGGRTAAPEAAPGERGLAETSAESPQRPSETAPGAGGISVSLDTLEDAQRAAERTGESMAAFVARAVAEQGKRDDDAFNMGINPAWQTKL